MGKIGAAERPKLTFSFLNAAEKPGEPELDEYPLKYTSSPFYGSLLVPVYRQALACDKKPRFGKQYLSEIHIRKNR